MVPIYDLAGRLDLYDTYRGLIVTHASLALPLLIWLMKGFFDAVPRDLEEAAWVDGASKLRAWAGVVLPQARPGLAVAAGFSFITAWAEVVLVIILASDRLRTIPFAFFNAAERGDDASVAAAIGVVYLLPVLILFLVLRRWMVKGIAGATTGL
jgi:ABC-type glycerol-3-phosphate transport system permease component